MTLKLELVAGVEHHITLFIPLYWKLEGAPLSSYLLLVPSRHSYIVHFPAFLHQFPFYIRRYGNKVKIMVVLNLLPFPFYIPGIYVGVTTRLRATLRYLNRPYGLALGTVWALDQGCMIRVPRSFAGAKPRYILTTLPFAELNPPPPTREKRLYIYWKPPDSDPRYNAFFKQETFRLPFASGVRTFRKMNANGRRSTFGVCFYVTVLLLPLRGKNLILGKFSEISRNDGAPGN